MSPETLKVVFLTEVDFSFWNGVQYYGQVLIQVLATFKDCIADVKLRFFLLRLRLAGNFYSADNERICNPESNKVFITFQISLLTTNAQCCRMVKLWFLTWILCKDSRESSSGFRINKFEFYCFLGFRFKIKPSYKIYKYWFQGNLRYDYRNDFNRRRASI